MQAIPIYIINLKRNPERKLFMQRQLDTFGLEYCFVDAIDKYGLESKTYRNRIAKLLDIDEGVLERKYDAVINEAKDEKEKSYLGRIACLLSHIQIYNSMVKNDIPVACILEDDATLLPTFPEILKTAAELDWDILMLASQPVSFNRNLIQPNYIKRIRIFNKDLLFISKKPKKTATRAKKQEHRIKQLLKEYGIDARSRPEQSEIFAKALQEYDTKYAEIIKTITPDNRRLSLIKHEQYIIYRTLRRHIKLYTSFQLGALPDKSSLDLITKYHCIAKPRTMPLTTTAYMLKQSVAMEWKQQALAENPMAIDEIPWQLYKTEQIKLRLITPPCVTPTYRYLIDYSTIRR